MMKNSYPIWLVFYINYTIPSNLASGYCKISSHTLYTKKFSFVTIFSLFEWVILKFSSQKTFNNQYNIQKNYF